MPLGFLKKVQPIYSSILASIANIYIKYMREEFYYSDEKNKKEDITSLYFLNWIYLSDNNLLVKVGNCITQNVIPRCTGLYPGYLQLEINQIIWFFIKIWDEKRFSGII